jgi:hypothetical protein
MKTMNVWRITATIGVVLLGCLARLDESGGAFAQQRAVALVTGRVINEAGDLLAGATVVVAAPAADMREVHPGSGHTTYSTKTDQDGRYAVRIPVGDGGGSIAVNAMLKGYQTAAGYQAAARTMMGGGDRRQARVVPGDVVGASFVLQPAAYVAGIVVDEHGSAVSGVEVTGRFRQAGSDVYVAITKTNAKGRFEVFDFPLGGARLKELEATGELEFKHRLFQKQTLRDVYALSANEQQELRIVLSKGHSISGTLLDENGNPSAGEMVELLFGDDRTKRVAVETDRLGRFHFSGLPAAKSAKLFSYAMQRRVSARLNVTLDHDQQDLELKLEPWLLSREPVLIEFLGMQVADINDELRAACELSSTAKGVLIFDPGDDKSIRGIGDLAAGDYFSAIAEVPVSSVRQLAERILSETAEQYAKGSAEIGCRAACVVRRPTQWGRESRYLSFTPDQIKSLRGLARTLAKSLLLGSDGAEGQ